METDTLNALVSGALWRAEQLEAHGIRSAQQAWAEVSALEEQLAKAITATESEGRIARRGSVRAALKAGDFVRAHALFEAYSADQDAPGSLKVALRKILEEADQAMSNRFRYAAKRYSPREARELSLRFRSTGAFGLSA